MILNTGYCFNTAWPNLCKLFWNFIEITAIIMVIWYLGNIGRRKVH